MTTYPMSDSEEAEVIVEEAATVDLDSESPKILGVCTCLPPKIVELDCPVPEKIGLLVADTQEAGSVPVGAMESGLEKMDAVETIPLLVEAATDDCPSEKTMENPLLSPLLVFGSDMDAWTEGVTEAVTEAVTELVSEATKEREAEEVGWEDGNGWRSSHAGDN